MGKTAIELEMPPQSRFMGLRLDLEIVDLIIELNNAGFITYVSCAGHHSIEPGKGMFRGFIGFRWYADKDSLIKILSAYGLKNIRVEDQRVDCDDYKGKATLVSFDPIGKPEKRFGVMNEIIDQLDNERQLELF